MVPRKFSTSEAFAVGVSVEEDDFSIKATVSGDPIFWIRIERPLRAETTITDLNSGNQTPSFCGRVLAQMTDGFSEISVLNVLDIFPGWSDHPTPQVELEARVNILRQVLNAALSSFDWSLNLSESNGKFSAVVVLERK